MMTLPAADDIVKLFLVVFITGFGAALGSKIIASIVPLTLSFFVGAFVPMPTLP